MKTSSTFTSTSDIPPAGQAWDSFFLDGAQVADDFLQERASQPQPDRQLDDIGAAGPTQGDSGTLGGAAQYTK